MCRVMMVVGGGGGCGWVVTDVWAAGVEDEAVERGCRGCRGCARRRAGAGRTGDKKDCGRDSRREGSRRVPAVRVRTPERGRGRRVGRDLLVANRRQLSGSRNPAAPLPRCPAAARRACFSARPITHRRLSTRARQRPQCRLEACSGVFGFGLRLSVRR